MNFLRKKIILWINTVKLQIINIKRSHKYNLQYCFLYKEIFGSVLGFSSEPSAHKQHTQSGLSITHKSFCGIAFAMNILQVSSSLHFLVAAPQHSPSPFLFRIGVSITLVQVFVESLSVYSDEMNRTKLILSIKTIFNDSSDFQNENE